MRATPWTDRIEVISGLLERQLALIDAQLQSVAESGAGQQLFVNGLNDIRELCSFTRDLVSTLPRPKPRWKILWRPRRVKDVLD